MTPTIFDARGELDRKSDDGAAPTEIENDYASDAGSNGTRDSMPGLAGQEEDFRLHEPGPDLWDDFREAIPVEEEVVNDIFGDSEGDGDSGDDSGGPGGHGGDGGPPGGPRARNTTSAKPRGTRQDGSRIEQLSAEVNLCAVEFAHHCRSSTSMEAIIKLAARLSCSPEVANEVAAQLDNGTVRIPSRGRAVSNKVRVDLLACLWERLRAHERTSWKYLLIDASPQHFWQMLNTRVLEISFPTSFTDREILKSSPPPPRFGSESGGQLGGPGSRSLKYMSAKSSKTCMLIN